VYYGLALVGFGPLGLLGGLALACLRMSAGTCHIRDWLQLEICWSLSKRVAIFSLASGKAAVGVLRT
jgi:hypothetical protein